jgi:hypothetical protein
MYVQRNIEERSRNHCCRRKTISITYSECVYVALVIQHAKAKALLHILSSVACLYHIFPRYLTNRTIFGKNY